MSLSIGMGGDIAYYERGADNEHVRDSEQHHDVHAERARSADYYTGDVEAGRELDGRWIGPGAEALSLKGNVTSWQLHKLYGEHVEPTTSVELGSRPRKFTTPEERLAARLAKEPFATEARKREIELSVSPKTPHTRNFLDLTFSVPKSYSVLYAALTAAGRDEDAQKLMAAHHRAIDECMKVLMEEAGYSRTGHHGRKVAGISTGQRIEAHDFVYSIFDHRLSRCGDPQVHSPCDVAMPGNSRFNSLLACRL